MAADEHLDLILEELKLADESGESMSHADLQESVGLGAADLQAAIDRGMERGVIANAEPGEYRLADTQAAKRAAAEAARGDDVEDEPEAIEGEDPPPPPPARERREQRARRGPAQVPARPPAPAAGDGYETVLLRGMVTKMSPETLGEMVKAGVEEAGDGEEFVLRVRA